MKKKKIPFPQQNECTLVGQYDYNQYHDINKGIFPILICISIDQTYAKSHIEYSDEFMLMQWMNCVHYYGLHQIKLHKVLCKTEPKISFLFCLESLILTTGFCKTKTQLDQIIILQFHWQSIIIFTYCPALKHIKLTNATQSESDYRQVKSESK